MNMRQISLSILAAAALFAFAACDQTNVDEVIPSAPVIESISPESAPVGAVITVTGSYLNAVSQAFIGDVPVDFVEKISDTKLSIRVANGVTSGKVILVNEVGRSSSDATFTCTFAVPSVSVSLLQKEAEMGAEVLISGSGLGAVTKVIFTAAGQTEGHEAKILVASNDEIVVRVPYVEDENAVITLGYFDGSKETFTDVNGAPSIKVIRYVPKFDAYTFERTAVCKSVTLTGEYLNNIEKVMVGDFEAPIFKEANKLSFTVPAGNFEDGETTVKLSAVYFEGNETVELDPAFVVYVPFVKFWENVRTWAQGRTEENEYVSFFSPENGVAYANSKWKDDLDPIAMKYQGAQWNAANTPKEGVVSDEEYNSVLPYFFISAVSGNVLQLNSPANSNSQLKNFYIAATGTPANDYRVPGSNNNMPGTPILAFRYLNPDASSEAESALAAKVIAGKIDNINEELFPINVDESTIAGISVSSLAGAVKSDKWCTRQTSDLAPEKDYKLDAVFLVAYYSNNGYIKDTPAKNIKRLGFLHITSIDWGIYNAQNYGSSRITYNFYWQKYDYDYSKL